MLRVGLIGFGLAGQAFHAPMIEATPGLELACFVTRNNAEPARAKYPAARIVATLGDLLADDGIRLCVVATPNQTHYEITRRCLEAGRDVVVDKPFTVTSAEAEKLIRLAETRGRVLSVYQIRRFDGDFLTVQKLLQSGALGRVVSYESHYDRYRPELKPGAWREMQQPGSGTLYDLGPHLIDQALVLFGVPRAISADIHIQREGGATDDAFDLRFEYPQMTAHLRSTMLACEPSPRYIIHGTQGSFIKHGMDPQEAPLRRGEPPDGPHWGEDPEAQWGTLYRCVGDSQTSEKVKTDTGDYRRFYANVRDAILEGAPLAVPARDGARVVRAIELALESARERRPAP